ncbi:MAG: hypothetical protein M1823_005695 [Watsoniomyces obsoletus]|nr:MAG: hypothetical protein M1823_005695 [Watsoniomyces obsoletus]
MASQDVIMATGSTTNPNPPERPRIRPGAVTASVYDIVPTIAAPHSTSINAIAATPDLRWVFSGGADGYIRKFDWVETVNGKVMLTVAQRHPFVDSVTKAGVLLSYWENEEPVKSPTTVQPEDDLSLSPVYSLAVHSQALWLLSGLDSGGINLQSVRHDEGKRIGSLKKHTSAVSVLTLSQDEKSVLSGSWDKIVCDWDLNTGQPRQEFHGGGGQISAIEFRPMSSLPVPTVSEEVTKSNGTLFGNNAQPPPALSNGLVEELSRQLEASGSVQFDGGLPETQPSPANSLFNGSNDADSLFEDLDDKNGLVGMPGSSSFPDDEEDEFSRAIVNGLQQADGTGEMNVDVGAPTTMTTTTMAPTEGLPPLAVDPSSFYDRSSDTLEIRDPDPFGGAPAGSENDSDATMTLVADGPSQVLTNGLPHAEETLASTFEPPQGGPVQDIVMNDAPPLHPPPQQVPAGSTSAEPPAASDTTFLAASMNGTLRVWDRRQPNPVATIFPRNVPPWCMNACWSPDGNTIYAGRRNGTVEEYSLHKGLRQPERVFKFPHGSGPVSAIKAMPNGRHLVCASFDILRLYDLKQQPTTAKHSVVPFLIVPGHRGGVISTLYIDPTCQYLLSAAGNRGWEGSSTEVLLGYEIGVTP